MQGNNPTHNDSFDRQASQALDQFKYEVAKEMQLNIPEDRYWGNISSAQCGAVGGEMVRKMIAMAEQNLAQRKGPRGRR